MVLWGWVTIRGVGGHTFGYARLPRVAACRSKVSWVVPTRLIRPKPL